MRPEDCVFFESREALRAWFEANHASAPVLQLGMHRKGSGRPSVTYAEALDEALCFGWIDGVRHSVDEQTFTQRFTPRRKGSNWSAINVQKVESLIERGLMREAGLRAFEQRSDPGGSSIESRTQELPPHYLERLQASDAAWQFFSSQAPWYRRAAASWVMDAKREETRERRLATLIADSEAGRRIALLSRPADR